jgi:hypothetical protein
MVMKFKVLTQNLKRGKWESGIRSQDSGKKAKVLGQNSKGGKWESGIRSQDSGCEVRDHGVVLVRGTLTQAERCSTFHKLSHIFSSSLRFASTPSKSSFSFSRFQASSSLSGNATSIMAFHA